MWPCTSYGDQCHNMHQCMALFILLEKCLCFVGLWQLVSYTQDGLIMTVEKKIRRKVLWKLRGRLLMIEIKEVVSEGEKRKGEVQWEQLQIIQLFLPQLCSPVIWKYQNWYFLSIYSINLSDGIFGIMGICQTIGCLLTPLVVVFVEMKNHINTVVFARLFLTVTWKFQNWYIS